MLDLLCFHSSDGCVNLAKKIGGDYSTFGTLLLDDKDGSEISAIEIELSNNAERIAHRIFTLWLKGKGKQPVTWSTLVSVLRDTELNQLATTIAEVIL